MGFKVNREPQRRLNLRQATEACRRLTETVRRASNAAREFEAILGQISQSKQDKP